MNIELALYSAIGFWNTAKGQENEIDRIMKFQKQRSLDDVERAYIFSFFVAAVTLKALSVELFLKYISLKKRGDFKHVHDLSSLYDDLDSEVQKIISRIETQEGISPIKGVIENHKDDFVEWRYIFENEDTNVDVPCLNDLDDVIKVLNSVAEKV